jgi:hypothetical protein
LRRIGLYTNRVLLTSLWEIEGFPHNTAVTSVGAGHIWLR